MTQAMRVALACLFALIAPAAASAAVPVTEVRTSGGPTCAGTLVSAQHVLTSRRCLDGRGPEKVLVVASTGALRVSRVATVHRRGPLALLQLTSRSELKPARIAAVGTSTRAGRRVRVRARRTSPGRLVARRCKSGRLCARARRRACVAGAALILDGRLAGVARPGCRGRLRASFTPLLDAGTHSWIEAIVAPEPPPPAFFTGVFAGSITQDNEGARMDYPTTLRIERDGAPGEIIGRSEYDTLPCQGSLTLVAQRDGGLELRETLTAGKDRCVDGGTIFLARVDRSDAVAYSWVREPQDGRSSGVLSRYSG